MLAAALENQYVKIKQSEGDGDVVIVQTALAKSEKGYPTIVTQDVENLVLMIAHALPDKPVLLMKPPIGKMKKKVFSSSALQQQHKNLSEFILLVQGFCGCVSTSAISEKERNSFWKIFLKRTHS